MSSPDQELDVQNSVLEVSAVAPTPRARDRAKAKRSAPPRTRTLRDQCIRGLIVVGVLALWQLASGPFLPRYAVSDPLQVGKTLTQILSSKSGWVNIRITAVELLVGLGVGVAIGTVTGLVLGTFRATGRILEPLIAAVNGIPKIALAPVFLIFFGLGIWSKVAIAAMGVSFVIFYNLYLGMRSVPAELVNVLRVIGAGTFMRLRYVTAPSLIQPFFAGLKAGGPLAMLGVIAGEFVASFGGIGHALQLAASALDASSVFAWLIILVAMSLAVSSVLNIADRIVMTALGFSR